MSKEEEKESDPFFPLLIDPGPFYCSQVPIGDSPRPRASGDRVLDVVQSLDWIPACAGMTEPLDGLGWQCLEFALIDPDPFVFNTGATGHVVEDSRFRQLNRAWPLLQDRQNLSRHVRAERHRKDCYEYAHRVISEAQRMN